MPQTAWFCDRVDCNTHGAPIERVVGGHKFHFCTVAHADEVLQGKAKPPMELMYSACPSTGVVPISMCKCSDPAHNKNLPKEVSSGVTPAPKDDAPLDRERFAQDSLDGKPRGVVLERGVIQKLIDRFNGKGGIC